MRGVISACDYLPAVQELQQRPIVWLVVSPPLTVSAISTVPAVPAILWHRRRTSGVELSLWGVVQGAVVCPGLRHRFRFNLRARFRFVVSSISLVVHPNIVIGDEAGVERISIPPHVPLRCTGRGGDRER